MREIVLYLSIYGVVFLTLFGIAEYLFHRQQVKAELTRKLVHFGAGVLSLSFPFLFEAAWPVLFLCGGFFGILLLSKKIGLLQSINGVQRKTQGAELFPLVVSVCLLVQNYTGDMMTYFLPILILSISDPIAALVGKRFPIGQYTIAGYAKTFSGSLAFLLSSFLIASVLMGSYTFGLSVLLLSQSFMIAVVATLAEAMSKNGYDNFTIPLSIMVVLLFLQNPMIC